MFELLLAINEKPEKLHTIVERILKAHVLLYIATVIFDISKNDSLYLLVFQSFLL